MYDVFQIDFKMDFSRIFWDLNPIISIYVPQDSTKRTVQGTVDSTFSSRTCMSFFGRIEESRLDLFFEMQKMC